MKVDERALQDVHTVGGGETPRGIYRCDAQDYIRKLRSFRASRTKR